MVLNLFMHSMSTPALAVGDLFGMSLQFIGVVLLAFVLLVLLASFLRYQMMMHELTRANPEDIDPEDRLKMKILEKMGTIHRAPRPFSLILFAVAEPENLVPADRPDLRNRLMEEVAGNIQRQVRADDQVFTYENRAFGVVMDVTRKKAREVAERVIQGVGKALIRNELGQLIAVPLKAGAASFPGNGDRVSALVERAETALGTALAGPGASCCFAPLPDSAEPEAEEDPASAASEPDASQAAYLDALTGVLKRERLEGALQKYISHYRKSAKPAALLLIDVDRLDHYNKHYGREGGDVILKALGGILEDHVREDDLIGRYDDDTFVVAMGVSAKNAYAAALRLNNVIKQTVITTHPARLKMSAGIGVAGLPEHGILPSEILTAASLALNIGKENGKGQSVLYNPETMAPVRDDGPFDSF